MTLQREIIEALSPEWLAAYLEELGRGLRAIAGAKNANVQLFKQRYTYSCSLKELVWDHFERGLEKLAARKDHDLIAVRSRTTR